MQIKKGCNKIKAIIMSVFFLISFSFLNVSLCQAYTDDAGIIGGLDKTTPIYDYLNTYNYRLYLSDHRYSQHDMYINSDNSVLVSIWNDRLGTIYILKSGYATDKGIEIGMTVNDIEYAYGKIYTDYKYTQYDRTGEYYKTLENDYYQNYAGYDYVEYVTKDNSGLSFVINKKIGKIVLIRYQSNRHGSTTVLEDVKTYNLLPYLR